jgi:uncharacterized protein (DUF1697 family)
MSGYAAFLRGVNLGPNRKISSAQLKELFEGLGFGDVTPFRTSGNVAFEAQKKPEAKLRTEIEKALEKAMGAEVTVFVRSAAEMRKLAKSTPFPAKQLAASKGKLQVALLATKPSAAAKKKVMALSTDDDRLKFGARELYWLPSGGTRNSALGMKKIDDLLAPTTIRTMGTIEQLVAKCFTQ